MQPIKIAILGPGRIAHTMARTVTQMEGIVPYAVAARELGRARAFADQYGFERAYGSYAEMLADPEVDLVYIATPHAFHAEQAKLCLLAGKHVLCEKPFTVNAAQAREVFALARERGLLAAEAIWPRYMPMAKTLRELCDSGVIGTPRSLTGGLAYPVTAKPRLTDPALAGGALLDIGIYPLTFASIAFGDDVVDISSKALLTEAGVDGQESITLTYRDGRMAVLHSSMVALGDRGGAIHGDKGYLVVENVNNFQSITVYDADRRQVARYDQPPQITGFEYEVAASAEAIRAGAVECPQMPHAETVRILEWMDALRAQWGVRYPFE